MNKQKISNKTNQVDDKAKQAQADKEKADKEKAAKQAQLQKENAEKQKKAEAEAHHKKNSDDITALKKAIAEIKNQRSKHD